MSLNFHSLNHFLPMYQRCSLTKPWIYSYGGEACHWIKKYFWKHLYWIIVTFAYPIGVYKQVLPVPGPYYMNFKNCFHSVWVLFYTGKIQKHLKNSISNPKSACHSYIYFLNLKTVHLKTLLFRIKDITRPSWDRFSGVKFIKYKRSLVVNSGNSAA